MTAVVDEGDQQKQSLNQGVWTGLADADIDSFIDLGYCVIKRAFSKETAEKCREWMWDKMEREHGICKDHPTDWPVKLPIGECYGKEAGAPWDEVYTESLQSSVDEICGRGRTSDFGCGWWMITFPQMSGNPELEWKPTGSWHIDGQHYNHYPYCKEVGITPVMYFSDVQRNWGGTAAAEGSHRNAAQLLRQSGLRGLQSNDMTTEILGSSPAFNISELTGEAGDVVIMHPLLIHARSTNFAPLKSSGVRFMCHPSVPLKEEMRFDRINLEEYSILEISIICGACGCSSQEWRKYATIKSLDCEARRLESDTEILTEKIEQCIRDLSMINPFSVAKFLAAREAKRKRSNSADDVPAEDDNDETELSVFEALGFKSFKCRS
jgi:hypothetical protein